MKPNCPRRVLRTVKGSQSTGAGGTTTVTVTPPFGRKWRIISAQIGIDEAGKSEYIYQYDGADDITILVGISSGGSGTPYMYPNSYAADAGKPTYAVISPQWVEQTGSIRFIVAAASASKTLTYRYCVEEFADDGHSASPT